MSDFLVIGELNVDVVVTGVPSIVEYGQVEQFVDTASLVLGSSSAIFASGLAALGLDVAFCGAAGDDRLGHLVLDLLRERGIDVSACEILPGVATGCTVILNRDGDRSLLTARGSIGQTADRHVPRQTLQACRHVHVGSGFLQEALLPDLPEIFSTARAAGATTSLDPNWDPSNSWRALDPVLRHVDVLFVNAAEAAAMTGLASVPAAGRALLERLCASTADMSCVVVKQGAAGATAVSRSGTVTALAPVFDVVDTTGAGDSFAAAFVWAWHDGRSLADSLAAGVAGGTLSTGGIGGTACQADLETLLKMAAEVATTESVQDDSLDAR